MSPPLSPKESLYYNAVALASGGDYQHIAKLKRKSRTWEHAYQHLKARQEVGNPEKQWHEMERFGVHLILREENIFPPLLKETHDPPFGIYIKRGQNFEISKLCDSTCLAIVGTRRGTPDGKSTTRKFARELAGAGFVIVSGLALGIDAAAHEGCLDGKGVTVAVLAGGLDSIYPNTNEQLGQRILANGGAFISEYPIGSPPFQGRFLERNRIVSGFSKGVLVVESPEYSGSLATARFALEQNRDVFVVPGPITHANFFGSHALIRQGAELVTKPADIMEAYGVTREDITLKEQASASLEEKLILEALRSISAPANIDKLIEMTRLEPRIANQAITFLLLKGIVKETERGYTI